jgi:WD40 repeat protein
MSPDGKTLASGSQDTTVNFWSVESGAELRTLHGHPQAVRALAFDVPAAQLASGCEDGSILIWNLKTGHVVRTMKGSKGPVLNLFFSADARWIVAYQSVSKKEKPVSIWDTTTGEQAVGDYLIEDALAPKNWPFRAVMQDVSRRALHQ